MFYEIKEFSNNAKKVGFESDFTYNPLSFIFYNVSFLWAFKLIRNYDFNISFEMGNILTNLACDAEYMSNEFNWALQMHLRSVIVQ